MDFSLPEKNLKAATQTAMIIKADQILLRAILTLILD